MILKAASPCPLSATAPLNSRTDETFMFDSIENPTESFTLEGKNSVIRGLSVSADYMNRDSSDKEDGNQGKGCGSHGRTIVWSERPEYKCEVFQLGVREVLRFKLDHPRQFGPFNKQRREAFGWYFAVAQAFFEAGADGASATG